VENTHNNVLPYTTGHIVKTCVMKPVLRCLRQAGLPFSIDKKKGKILPE